MSRLTIPLLSIVAVLLAANLVRLGGDGAQSGMRLALAGFPTGACCFADGSCSIETNINCEGVLGGEWAGEDVTCEAANCQPFGGCCLGDATCVIAYSAEECEALSGYDDMFDGLGVPCGQIECRGVCCTGNSASCSENTRRNECSQPEWIRNGLGGCSACSPFGACCTPSGECIAVRSNVCETLGGTFVGEGVNCLSVDCNSCPEDVTGNGEVDFADLVSILSAWGPCEP